MATHRSDEFFKLDQNAVQIALQGPHQSTKRVSTPTSQSHRGDKGHPSTAVFKVAC